METREYLNSKLRDYKGDGILYKYVSFLYQDLLDLLQEDLTERNLDKSLYPNLNNIITITDFMVTITEYKKEYLTEIIEDILGIDYKRLREFENVINVGDLN